MLQDVARGSENLPHLEYLKFGPITITVAVVPGLYKSCGLYGDWDEKTRCIRLAGDQPVAVLAQTLLHELLHVASDLYHLRLSEQSVRCLENAITALLRDYPEEAHLWLDSLTK